MRLKTMDSQNIFRLEQATLSFTPGAIVAIVGKNGSGKSSIMDNINVALFGEPSEARPVAVSEILRNGTPEGFVVLDFSVNDNNGKEIPYRVERRFKRAKNDSVSHSAVLSKFDGGNWTLVADGAVAVNEEIAAIISPWRNKEEAAILGLEGRSLVTKVRNAFQASVLLAQGRVTQLLDDTPAGRWMILAPILGIEDGEKMKITAKEALDAAKFLCAQYEGRLATLKESIGQIPSEDELTTNIEKTKEELLSHIGKKEIVARAVKISDERQNLVRNKEFLESSVKTQKATLAAMEKSKSMYDAAKVLFDTRETAGQYRDILLAEKKIVLESEATREKLEELKERISGKTKALETADKNLEDISSRSTHSSEASELIRLEGSLSTLVNSVKKLEDEVSDIEGKIERGKSVLKSVTGIELTEQLQAKKALLEQVNVKVEQFRTTLLEAVRNLLTILADEKMVIRVDELSGENCEQLVNGLSKSGLEKHLESLSHARGETSMLSRDVETLSKTLLELGEFNPDINRMYVEKGRAAVESSLAKLDAMLNHASGKLESCVSETGNVKKRISEIRTTVPGWNDIDTESLQTVVTYAGKLDAASKSRNEIAHSLMTLEREKNLVQEDLSRFSMRLFETRSTATGLRNTLVDLSSAWKSHVTSWDRERISECVAMSMKRLVPIGDRAIRDAEMVLSGMEQKLEDVRRKLPEAENALRDTLPKIGIPEDELSMALRELEDKIAAENRSIGQMSGHLEGLNRLRDELCQTEQQFEKSRQLLERAKQFNTLVSGREFPHYVMDRAFEVLLAPVNEILQQMDLENPFTLFPDAGKICVQDSDGVRTSNSLSGGERTLVSILLLQQIQKITKFEQVLFIDEGLAMLDTKNIETIINTLGESSNSFTAISTHDPDVASQFPCWWVVSNGHVKECSGDMSPEELDKIREELESTEEAVPER